MIEYKTNYNKYQEIKKEFKMYIMSKLLELKGIGKMEKKWIIMI